MSTESIATTTAALSAERRDLLEALHQHRHFLRFPARDLDDEQAARRTTASELTLGGLLKHVAEVEDTWARFIVEGPSVFPPVDQSAFEAHAAGFRMLGSETLAGLLDTYDAVAARTDELVATVDLDHAHPLPEAPWFTPGATWSARRALLHIVAETAQHAGHADIIREALDGAKSMG